MTEEMITAEYEVQEELAALPERVEVITAEINIFKAQAAEGILEIGNRLTEAKNLLEHGQFRAWLKEKVAFSERAAQNFMRIAREYSNPHPVADLGASKALILLALSAPERDEFMAQKHDVNGDEKTVDEMSKRELEQAVRDKAAALRRAEEAEAEKAKLDELKKAAEKKAADADKLAAKLEKAKEAEKKALDELQKLRNNPEIPKSTMDSIKADAKAEAAADTEKKIADAVAAAEADMKRLTAEAESAKAAADKAGAELEAAKKKLALADPDTQEFKVIFSQWQETHLKLMALLSRIEASGNEAAPKLRMAVKTVLKQMAEKIEA